MPGVYANLPEQSQQDVVTHHEVEKIGFDHACVGGWLLKRWNFPERIEQAVAASHDPGAIPSAHEHGLFARCVALTSLIAELFLDETGDSGIKTLADAVEEHLGLNKQQLGELLEEISVLIPEAETLFETQILAEGGADRIMEEAREVLMLRSLHALQTVDSLQGQAVSLENRTKELEESSRRDALTGLYNRRFLDGFLQDTFVEAIEKNRPLSIAFADLDKFKSVNDTYGHQAGDRILVATARPS